MNDKAKMNSFYDPHKPVHKSEGHMLHHWQQDGKVSFVTFRLADSLPQEAIRKIAAEANGGDPAVPIEQRRMRAVFRYMDAGYGACLLSNPQARDILEGIIMNGTGREYELYAGVIMPNHVHLLLRAGYDVSIQKAIETVKAVSAHAINKHFHRQGSLWQRDYFDRLVRDNVSFLRIIEYISANPHHCPAATASLFDPSACRWLSWQP